MVRGQGPTTVAEGGVDYLWLGDEGTDHELLRLPVSRRGRLTVYGRELRPVLRPWDAGRWEGLNGATVTTVDVSVKELRKMTVAAIGVPSATAGTYYARARVFEGDLAALVERYGIVWLTVMAHLSPGAPMNGPRVKAVVGNLVDGDLEGVEYPFWGGRVSTYYTWYFLDSGANVNFSDRLVPKGKLRSAYVDFYCPGTTRRRLPSAWSSRRS